MSSEKRAQKTISLRRPMSGSRKRPTCTVPAEHSQARQTAEDNYGKGDKFKILGNSRLF